MARRVKRPQGRPRLGGPGDPTVKIITWLPASLRRKLGVRRAELGLTESEYMRRLIENAVLRVPSEQGGTG